MEILSDPTPDTLAMPRFDDGAIDMQELLRRLAEQVVNAVMDAEADQLCGGGANSSALEGSRRLLENRAPPRTTSFQPMSRRLPAGNGVVGHDERDDPDRVLCGGVLVIAARGHEVELGDGGIA